MNGDFQDFWSNFTYSGKNQGECGKITVLTRCRVNDMVNKIYFDFQTSCRKISCSCIDFALGTIPTHSDRAITLYRGGSQDHSLNRASRCIERTRRIERSYYALSSVMTTEYLILGKYTKSEESTQNQFSSSNFIQRCQHWNFKLQEIFARERSDRAPSGWGPGARLRAPGGVQGAAPPEAPGF